MFSSFFTFPFKKRNYRNRRMTETNLCLVLPHNGYARPWAYIFRTPYLNTTYSENPEHWNVVRIIFPPTRYNTQFYFLQLPHVPLCSILSIVPFQWFRTTRFCTFFCVFFSSVLLFYNRNGWLTNCNISLYFYFLDFYS